MKTVRLQIFFELHPSLANKKCGLKVKDELATELFDIIYTFDYYFSGVDQNHK